MKRNIVLKPKNTFLACCTLKLLHHRPHLNHDHLLVLGNIEGQRGTLLTVVKFQQYQGGDGIAFLLWWCQLLTVKTSESWNRASILDRLICLTMIFHKYYQHIIIPASALPIIKSITSAPSSSSFILLYCSQGGFSARKVPNSLRQRFKGEQPEAQSLSSLSPSSSTSPSGNFQHVQLQIETEDIVKGPGVKNT